MTDEQVEKIIKANMSLQMNIPGIRADFEEALRKPWVGLTEDEIDFLELKYAPPIHPDFETDADHCYVLIKKTEAKLKEKNT